MQDEELARLTAPELIDLIRRILEELELRQMEDAKE